jgi:hypothetical protein
MSSKNKSHPLNGPHTAGIFADMTVDGPVIGTLVAIVDRAKNLPNRKTIGKQDPYCAARLGKEAKKTATDIRGGQTPKWYVEPSALFPCMALVLIRRKQGPRAALHSP